MSNIVKLSNIPGFDIAKTFECGQCFRWNIDTDDGVYTGVVFGRALQVRQDSGTVYLSCNAEDFHNIWRVYFDIDRDYEAIRKKICISGFMEEAVNFGSGIRILRQEPWETLCSFIISQRSNIPRIKSTIETLCRLFGNKLEINGQTLYTFPAPGILAELTPGDLAPLRCGYRDKYIIAAAKAVAYNKIKLDSLFEADEQTTKQQLMKLTGVGVKVAECVMLFGLNKLNSFPIDTHILKALKRYFPENFDPKVFSPYAGIAQQYIFNYMRNGNL